MDDVAESARQEHAVFESGLRKGGLSDKLNKLKNSAFGRRRTSGTDASSASSTNLPRRSYIPTPSFGSRTSSLFGGLGLSTADLIESSGTQPSKRKDSRTGGSTASTRRHSRLVSESTSSFFGSTTEGRLYPREFLENPVAGAKSKENRRRNKRPTESSGLSQQRQAQHRQPVSSPRTRSEYADSSETNEPSSSATARHDRASELPSPSTVKKSLCISSRFASTTFFKSHPVRHSIAALPLTSRSKAKDRESSVKIEERRLMAPINPPLPRSTTMGPLTTQSVHSSQQFSPRTPNFMRSTSSSAARTSDISNVCKVPPTPLRIASGQKSSDMPSFFSHREGRRAAEGVAKSLGSEMILHETITDRPSAIEEKAMAHNRQGTEWDQATWTTQDRRILSPRMIDPTTFRLGELDSELFGRSATNRQRYSPNSHYTSTPEVHTVHITQESQPLVPRVPQQLVSKSTSAGYEGQRRELPHGVPQASRIPRSISKAANLQTERTGNGVLGMQTSASESHLPKNTDGKPPPSRSWRMETVHRGLEETTQMYHTASPPRKMVSTLSPSSTALEDVGSAMPANNDHDDDAVDLKLVRGTQDLRFWAGRYTVMSDRMCNDALISPGVSTYVIDDRHRQRVVLQHLREVCADEEALESLNAFVRAWEHGWSAGVREAFLGILPRRLSSSMGAPVLEEKKKGGFMGKMFGRMKS